MGLGFLSKYTSPLQWMCWVVFFALWPPARQQLRKPGPYLAILINLLCTLPVLIWNAHHDWITVQHVARHGGAGEPWRPTLRYLGDFLAAEFALFNPVFFIGILVALVGFWRRHRADLKMTFFFSMGAPVFLLYVLLTLKTRVQANWIAPAVLPLLCLMTLYWWARHPSGSRWIKPVFAGGLILGFAFTIILHETRLVGKVTGLPVPPKIDPLTRVRGYKELARLVGEAREHLSYEGKPVFIIGDGYGVTSQIAFNLPVARDRVADSPITFCPTESHPTSQYYFWPGYADRLRGQNALYVTELKMPRMLPGWHWKWLRGETNLSEPWPTGIAAPEGLQREFESVTNLGVKPVLYRGQPFHFIQIFECRNLR
jgi:hypothetical protein